MPLRAFWVAGKPDGRGIQTLLFWQTGLLSSPYGWKQAGASRGGVVRYLCKRRD